MNTLTIQPTLTPCNGSLDLISDFSPCGMFIELTWGTTLFLRIPHNRQTAVFRIIAGLFCQFGFEQKAVSSFLGVSTKTLRRWRNCLTEGTWDSLSVLFEGVHSRKLPDYLAMYARKRYRDFVDAGKTSPVHGYNQIIAGEIKEIWNINVGYETLRLIFREEDRETKKEAAPMIDDTHSAVDPVTEVCDTEDLENIPESHGDGSLIEAERTGHGELGADLPSMNKSAHHPVSDEADSLISEENGEGLIEAERTGHGELGADLPSMNKSAHHPVSDEAEGRMSNENGSGESSTKEIPEKQGGLIISGETLEEPIFSSHAGLFILSPWFETAFGACSPIIRQTAAQIVLSEVNQEQSKNICFTSLEYFVNNPKRTPYTQRKLLDYGVLMDASSTVWRGNATLTGAGRQSAFYFDPNVVVYTGKKKVLMTWSGLDKAPKKGTNLDFFHTINGTPCYIGHDDGYYDARQRFLMVIERMRWLIEANQKPLTFIQDRGFWGDEFMKAMIALGLYFIQWEKNYSGDGWEDPFEREGKMSIVRHKNSSGDKRKISFTFREQTWSAHPNGRRIIVRTYDRKKRFEEFSVVTNNPDMRAEEVIRLMFNRWVQEGDFSYENRHFGIQEMTARKANTYADIEDTLEDREVDSRAYKKANSEKASLQSKLGRQLVKLNGMPNPSPTALESRIKRLKDRASKLRAELAAIDPQDAPSSLIERIGNRIKKVLNKQIQNELQEKQITKRQQLEEEISHTETTLEEHEAIMEVIPRKESRLQALIDDGKVKLEMGRKALVDSTRVTSRNVFCEAHKILRPIYNNYREDHVTLRQLTQSPGVITQAADGTVNIYLRPQLDRQDAQWKRIRTFLDIVEHRIRQQFGTVIKFHIKKTSAEIFDAAARMKNRLKS